MTPRDLSSDMIAFIHVLWFRIIDFNHRVAYFIHNESLLKPTITYQQTLVLQPFDGEEKHI